MHDAKTEEFSLKIQATPGDAYFLKEGAPHKARPEEDASDPDVFRSPLLQFDLKFDFLRDYLGNVTTVLNQHASLLNKIQFEVAARVGKLNFSESIKQCAKNSTLKDEEVNKILLEMIRKPLLENSGDSYNDAVNSFCNRLGIISYGFSYFHKMNKEFQQTHKKLEQDLEKKVEITDFKIKVKKAKKKLREELKEKRNLLDDRISELEHRLIGKIAKIEEKVTEVEKQTLWKIKDCEDLLKSRINDAYVDDSLKKLEEKLRIEIEKNSVGKFESLQRAIDDAMTKLKMVEDNSGDKFNQFKKYIKDIETQLFKKVEITKLEDIEKAIHSRMDKNTDEVRGLARRCEPAIEKVDGNVKSTNEAMARLAERLENMSITLENYMLLGGSRKGESMRPKNEGPREEEVERNTGGDRLGVAVGGAKQMAEIQITLARYKGEIDKLTILVNDIQTVLKDKVSMTTFESELRRKADRGEMDRDRDRDRGGSKNAAAPSIDSGQLDKIQKTIQEIQQRLDKMDELYERKMLKLKKDLDVTAIMKVIKLKADEENVQKGFENVDTKITSIAETLQILKKDIDQSSLLLQKMSVQSFKVTDNAFLSTKPVGPQACLSCGHTAIPSTSIYNVQGKDKRWYKGEENSVAYDNLNNSEIQEAHNFMYGEEKIQTSLNVSFDTKFNQKISKARINRTGIMPEVGVKPRTLSKAGIMDLAVQANRPSLTPGFSRPSSAKK